MYVIKMTHARDPKQMFLKIQEKKDEEAEEAGTATDRHRQNQVFPTVPTTGREPEYSLPSLSLLGNQSIPYRPCHW